MSNFYGKLSKKPMVIYVQKKWKFLVESIFNSRGSSKTS
jgi:hypothetical protein